MIRLAVLSMALLGAITLATSSSAMAIETTVSGKVVNVAQWVSNDSTTMMLNIPDIMMSSMMSNGSARMSGSGTTMSTHHPSGQSMTSQEMPMGKGMRGGMMQGCHAMIGVVTSSGVLYVLLANQASPMGALTLCGRIGQQVTVTGPTYSRGGMRALLVSRLSGE